MRAGAELIFVATNNAWYGEGCAEQHAAQNVQSSRKTASVLRCGNGGWSGWIDAYGTIREVLRDKRARIFGAGNFTVFQYSSGCVKRVTTPATATGLLRFAAGWPQRARSDFGIRREPG